LTQPQKLAVEEVDTNKLALTIRKHASESQNEEQLKIRVEATLRPILDQWGIQWASYEHRHEISGRKDALYGRVIIEYKEPSILDSASEFKKGKEQVKKYITSEAGDPKDYGRYFGVLLDGNKISFVRFRRGAWEEQEQPLGVNAQTVLRLLQSIRGLRRKPIDAESLLLDFGPKSEISKKAILILYNSLVDKNAVRTDMLFSDWKRVFSQVCSYSTDKLVGLVDCYGLEKKVDVEKLLFAVHTYYTILMKLLTSEIVTLFADSLLGSYLKRVEEAYYRNPQEMRTEMQDLEEGGIFALVGIRNFLEADYFAWYLDEWNKEIGSVMFELTERLLEYEPATVELNPERVKDLFKRLYQNLVPREIRHKLGEYFTPDWLAELLLDEVGYDGNPEKSVLDPACGSGTFLVLTIKRIREYAEDHFVDQRTLVTKIIQNVRGIDLNPLAALAAKANYLIALSDLIRYRPREGIEIPIYLADSISVVRRATLYGSDEYELHTNEGKFWITKEVIDKNQLNPVLSVISEGIKVGWTKDQFERALSKDIPLSQESIKSFIRLYDKILKLERYGKNGIWSSLLKNSFSPMLIGKFDYVVGNPPWINWENLPEFYRESTKHLWDQYGLLAKTKGMGLGKVKRDMAMLFTSRCLDIYAKESGRFAFLIPFTCYKTQAGAGFRKFLANGRVDGEKKVPCSVLKIHDLVTLYPFEGATNRTSLLAIEKQGKTQFPISCTMWHNSPSKVVNQEEDLEHVKKLTKQYELILAPIEKGKPETSWTITTAKAYGILQGILKPSQYRGYEGTNTALNGVYWVETIEKDGLLFARNLSNVGKIKVRERNAPVEPDLVFPLLRGRDVKKWYAHPSCNILLPFQQDGKIIDTADLKVRYRKAFRYLQNFEKELKQRSIYRLFAKELPFYYVHGVGAYTFAPYKVLWKEISGEIAGKGVFFAATVSRFNDKIVIPDHKLMFIPFQHKDEAFYVCSVLNSTICRLIVMSYTIETAISTHILEHVYVPKFDTKNRLHLKLSELSQQAHELANKFREQNDSIASGQLTKVEEEVDTTVGTLYGIEAKELDEMKKALEILKGESANAEEEVD
jgi:hypothetical protein